MSTEVTDDHVGQLKERLHITHSTEDKRLKSMIVASYAAIQASTGLFSIDDVRGFELVLERCRYAYNDSVEYFEDNFLSQLLSFGLELYAAEQRAEEAGVE